jgi:hypothetical protein
MRVMSLLSVMSQFYSDDLTHAAFTNNNNNNNSNVESGISESDTNSNVAILLKAMMVTMKDNDSIDLLNELMLLSSCNGAVRNTIYEIFKLLKSSLCGNGRLDFVLKNLIGKW